MKEDLLALFRASFCLPKALAIAGLNVVLLLCSVHVTYCIHSN